VFCEITHLLPDAGTGPEDLPQPIGGLPVAVVRTFRKVFDKLACDWFGKDTFCPPAWSDLAIGSDACGFGCRCYFLMLTFRA